MESVSQSLLFLIIILAAAKLGAEIATFLKQPAVLGELIAGILLGLTPLRNAANDNALLFLAAIGIILLLFEVGLESELDEFRQVAGSATLVAVIGVVLPLIAGSAVTFAITGKTIQSLFMGAALTATSVGITARVLADIHETNSIESKIILGAAIVDDILGLLILSVVLRIVKFGEFRISSMAASIGVSVAFLVAAIWAGIYFAPVLIKYTSKLKTRGVIITVAFVFCLALAYAADKLGLAEIIGAFAAGLILATTDDRVNIQQRIKPVADIFIPVFFVLVGLRVNLAELNPFGPSQTTAFLIGLLLLLLAIITKLASGLGVLAKNANRLAVGVGMIPRGEVGLIFASIGLQQNIIPQDLYAELVLIVFITTLITPPWLAKIFGR